MAVFVGEFEQVVDAKNRVAIPSPLRDQMVLTEDGENFYLVLGTKKHLWLFPELYYRKMIAQIDPSPLPSHNSEKYRMYFGLARVVKPDAQGRVVLPEKCRQRAVIKDDVTLVGCRDHIELWPTDEWEAHVAQAMEKWDDTVLEAGDRLEASAAQHGQK